MMLSVCVAIYHKQGLLKLGNARYAFPDLFTGTSRLQPIKTAFTKCCQESGFLMVVKCQQENAALKECLTTYYNDPAFYEECKIEYLKQREEFRATGIPAKQRQQKLPTSM
ncbi:COX assembly mitochondrial protein homolog isoform X1 [Eretmochelys imbricata]